MFYHNIELSKDAKKDLDRISIFLEEYNVSRTKIIEKINNDIKNLTFMPRIHKTLIYFKDKHGEYRRIVSGKYIIIYKIVKDEIIILRIFNQKENYLNQRNFILKEESENYMLNRRRKINMTKLKTLKNSYLKLRENYNRMITGKEVWSRYMNRLIEEAEESLKTEGYITLEELREELIREYNVNI